MQLRILLLPVFVLFLFCSCEQSKKGAWTKGDKNKCVNDGMSNMDKDADFKMAKELFKIDEKKFATCICDKLEKDYESYSIADKSLENTLNQEKAIDLFKSCLGPEFENLMNNME
jgi:hypothetical protein